MLAFAWGSMTGVRMEYSVNVYVRLLALHAAVKFDDEPARLHSQSTLWGKELKVQSRRSSRQISLERHVYEAGKLCPFSSTHQTNQLRETPLHACLYLQLYTCFR